MNELTTIQKGELQEKIITKHELPKYWDKDYINRSIEVVNTHQH